MADFPVKDADTAGDGSPLSNRQNDLAAVIGSRVRPDTTGDTPSLVVSIYDAGSKPSTAPNQFAAHPATVGWTETEGGTYSATVDTAQSLIVTVLGNAPGVGELLLAFLIDGRWVAEKRGTTVPPDVIIPGCPCSSSPRTLTMTSSRPESNNRIFQNATLVYGPTPTALWPLGIGHSSYLSTTSFTDLTTGDQFWYHFSCYIGYYVLTRVYPTSLYGSPFRDSTRYRWPIGLSGNTCRPFNLIYGQVFAGGDPTCIVTITG